MCYRWLIKLYNSSRTLPRLFDILFTCPTSNFQVMNTSKYTCLYKHVNCLPLQKCIVDCDVPFVTVFSFFVYFLMFSLLYDYVCCNSSTIEEINLCMCCTANKSYIFNKKYQSPYIRYTITNKTMVWEPICSSRNVQSRLEWYITLRFILACTFNCEMNCIISVF